MSYENKVSIMSKGQTYTLGGLCEKYGRDGSFPHVFIGNIACSDLRQVFLISFDRIIRLEDMASWDDKNCTLSVETFVTLQIQATPIQPQPA